MADQVATSLLTHTGQSKLTRVRDLYGKSKGTFVAGLAQCISGDDVSVVYMQDPLGVMEVGDQRALPPPPQICSLKGHTLCRFTSIEWHW